jgi:C-terminal processing protease CtpA/Prc
VVVELASRKELAPDGARLAGRGVDPDVTIDLPGGAYRDRDAVFDAAYDLLVQRLESKK